MTASDLQPDAVARWLEARGRARPETLSPLPGDVSPRRYARLAMAEGKSTILALYPATLSDACSRFATTSRWLERAGVRVPSVLETDCDRGWMLVEDLGERTVYDLAASPWSELWPYYDDALRQLELVAALDPGPVEALNPTLDAALLRQELQQTWDLFLEPRGLLGDRKALERGLDTLCVALGDEPPRPCHRDFMVRNLVPLEEGAVAVLDHQDLRLGPPAYDLASLLNDSLFAPDTITNPLLERFFGRGADLTGYHRAAVQRTLKAVGTFEAFRRRGSDRHLRLVLPTLRACLRHLPRVPELAPLTAGLTALWTSTPVER